MTVASAPDIVMRILADKPSFHLSGTARWDALPQTLEAIAGSVQPGDSTLEVGVGVSTIVFAASGASHTAISLDAIEHQRVRQSANESESTTNGSTSSLACQTTSLPRLLTCERTLDVALIDGAHSFPLPVVDWHYVTRALKIGGTLLLDDIPVPAVMQVFRHMKLDPNWRLDGIFDDRAAAFSLIATPEAEDDWRWSAIQHWLSGLQFRGTASTTTFGERVSTELRCVTS